MAENDLRGEMRTVVQKLTLIVLEEIFAMAC